MTSRTTVLAVIIALGLVAVGCLASATAIVLSGDKAPDQLWTLGATAVGALASVLASTRSTLGPNDTEPTTVQATVAMRAEAPAAVVVEPAPLAPRFDA